ncbi:LOW QUALITY PROTEIN: regulator of MON1-CCZ1 complex protein bulli [Choristoneura fumiferana]|uniref:LOW QUALITY PROTEIN: regulator of MON1-CCZ1 complex protein bulli n=1 Tax=Choristoneura fumiferana TaxID=7141 RepID=UPI003D1555ED
MAKFCLNDSDEYYLALSEQPKRFDADSPVTNVFFDDTNGQVFTVRSGGVTGVTVSGMDDSKSTSFRMEDRGPIISIKFSPDFNILAIQRNSDNMCANVEFVNFKDLAPTNVEYSHTCKWKNAKILGFVWPRVNEIAFITDHGIELLQVFPEKKQLKTLKSTAFSGAWFSWCAQSNIVLLAGNNGALLQPFALNNSTINKMQKLELESAKPVVERDVILLRLCGATWCAVFRHGSSASLHAPGPTELWLLPISSGCSQTHILRTGLAGRFAVSVLDHLVAVHHQSSQTSQIFDIMEDVKCEPSLTVTAHAPLLPALRMRPAYRDDQLCPMYSGNWVVFQPDYIIDARLGCLWRVRLLPEGLAHSVPKDEISKVVSVLLRRTDGKETIYRILHQLVADPAAYLVQLSRVFDEINAVYRKWADQEVARNTAGEGAAAAAAARFPVLVTQEDMCALLQPHNNLVQVVTAYLASLSRHNITVQQAAAALAVRALVTAGAGGRLRALARRGALADTRPLACQLLALAHTTHHAQLALDMMWRLHAVQEIEEVLLSWNEPISAIGAAKQAGVEAWHAIPARKLLQAGKLLADQRGDPGPFAAIYRALQARNEKLRGTPCFLKGGPGNNWPTSAGTLDPSPPYTARCKLGMRSYGAPRASLEAGKQLADQRGHPGPFAAIYRALQARNEKLRGTPCFLKGGPGNNWPTSAGTLDPSPPYTARCKLGMRSYGAPRASLKTGKQLADQRGDPGPFAAIYRALQARNEKLRGTPCFLRGGELTAGKQLADQRGDPGPFAAIYRALQARNEKLRGTPCYICPMVRFLPLTLAPDSGNWVVFQPDYIIDARLGCLWRVRLLPEGLAHSVPKDEISKVVSVLLRRTDGKETIYRILHQLVADPAAYLVQLSRVFDEINAVYRKWADQEVARNTAGEGAAAAAAARFPVLVTQEDMCALLQPHNNLVQVVTAYLASLSRHNITVQQAAAALAVRALVTGGAAGGCGPSRAEGPSPTRARSPASCWRSRTPPTTRSSPWT